MQLTAIIIGDFLLGRDIAIDDSSPSVCSYRLKAYICCWKQQLASRVALVSADKL